MKSRQVVLDFSASEFMDVFRGQVVLFLAMLSAKTVYSMLFIDFHQKSRSTSRLLQQNFRLLQQLAICCRCARLWVVDVR